MKRKIFLGLVLAFVAALAIVPSLQAGMGSGGIGLVVSGPVSVLPGKTLQLSVTGTCTLAPTNPSGDGITWIASTVDWASMQVVVMNPWTGAVLSGPTAVTVNQTLTGGTYDQYGNPIAAVPYIESDSQAIAKTDKAGQALVAVIYAMDAGSHVIGTTFWGFVVQ